MKTNSHKLKKYKKLLESGVERTDAMVIYNMILEGCFELGSTKWVKFFDDIGQSDFMFSWYEFIQIAENSIIIGCPPELELMDSIKLLSYIKDECKMDFWKKQKNKKDSQAIAREISRLPEDSRQTKLPFLYSDVIYIGNTILYDINGESNGNGYVDIRIISIYIDYFRDLSEEQAIALKFYLEKYEDELN